MQSDTVKFEKGAILRREMLESLYNYPRFLTESYFSQYNDGLLYGLEWIEIDEKHGISPGALKYKNRVYFQTDAIFLEDELPTGNLDAGEYYLYFKEAPAVSSYSREVYELKLSIEDNPICGGLCYKYLKFEFGNFKVLNKKKIFGLYASPEKNGFAIPYDVIDSELLPVISEKQFKHPLDYEIMKTVCLRQPLPVSLVKLYISEYNLLKNYLKETHKKIIHMEISRDNVRRLLDNLIEAAKELTVPAAFEISQSSEAPKENENHTYTGKLLC